MKRKITITLPDGSAKELPTGATGGEVAASIGKGLAKAAVAAKVDGEWVDLDRPIDHDATVAIVTANSDEGREVLRHSTSHLMAQAVFDLVPGREVRDRPRDRRRLLLRLRAARTASTSPTTTSSASRRGCARSSAEDEPFVREEYDFDRGLELFADQPYKQEIIRNVSSGAADDDDAGEVTGDGTVGVYKNLRADGSVAYVDLCRGPHVPSTGKLGAFKLHEGRRRVLARRREAPDAPADLRHRVGERQGARGVPAPARGGRAARPPQARRRSSTCSRSRRRSAPGSRSSIPKGGTVRRIMEEYSRQRHIERGLRVRQLAAHHEVEPVRGERAPRLVRRRHVPADAARRRHGRTT